MKQADNLLDKHRHPADIDVDISSHHRPSIIKYIRDKYGLHHTASLRVYSRLKQADVILLLAPLLVNRKGVGLDESSLDLLERAILLNRKEDDAITCSIEKNEAVARLFANSPELQIAREIADALAGAINRSSAHPSGIIISNKEVAQYGPCSKDPQTGQAFLDMDFKEVEEAGFLKFDLLSLSAMNVLGYCKMLSGQTSNLAIDHEQINQAVWESLSSGENIGIPQFDTSLGRKTLKKFTPRSFEHVAMLYQPA